MAQIDSDSGVVCLIPATVHLYGTTSHEEAGDSARHRPDVAPTVAHCNVRRLHLCASRRTARLPRTSSNGHEEPFQRYTVSHFLCAKMHLPVKFTSIEHIPVPPLMV
jgi:hypothetical protein